MYSTVATNQPNLSYVLALALDINPQDTHPRSWRPEPATTSCSHEVVRNFACFYAGDTQQGVTKSVGRLRATLDIYPREWLHISIFGHQLVRPRDIHLRGRVSVDITTTRIPTEDG